MPLREGTPPQEYLTPGDDERAFGGVVRHDKGVEGVIEFMSKYDEALETGEKKELNDVLDAYSSVLNRIAAEADPVKLQQLEEEKIGLRKRLEGDRAFAEQVERELTSAQSRSEAMEVELSTSKRVASLYDQEKPENPSTEQAELITKLYRDLMYSYDQMLEVRSYMKALESAGVPLDSLTVTVDEPTKAAPSNEHIQIRFDRLIAERQTVIGELNGKQDIFRHPEQFTVAQIEGWHETAWRVLEELLLLKRQLQDELSNHIETKTS